MPLGGVANGAIMIVGTAATVLLDGLWSDSNRPCLPWMHDKAG